MQASRLTAIAGCDRSGATWPRGGEARLAHAELCRPLIDFVVAGVVGLRHVGQQQFQHHLLRRDGALAVGGDVHAGGRGAAAADGASTRSPLISTMQERQLPTASRPVLVAQARNLHAFALGDLHDGFVGPARDFAPVT